MADALLPSDVLDHKREQIRAILAATGVTDAGVLGSVARGQDIGRSDLDLIVAFRPGSRRDLVRIADEIEELTGLSVDIVDQEWVLERAQRTCIEYTILRDYVPL